VNLAPVLQFLGRLLWLLAAAQAVPMACAMLYAERIDAMAFAVSATVTAAFGTLLYYLGRRGGALFRTEGILIVVGGWVLASAFGSLPYLFTGTFLQPIDALFESASGFTTTGASVMTDIESAGKGILLWRSFTQWLGGMGIIVLFVALLPQVGPGARFLYKLEVPGPTSEGLHPRIRDTAAILWKLYLLLTAAQVILLVVVGLDLYDALTHTFSTLSTGGFSPRNASAGAFGPGVHLVLIVFMVIAGGNFSLYYAMRRGRGWNLLRDAEFRIYLILMAVATVLVAADLFRHAPGTARTPLDSLFQVVSIMTTTGFATANFDAWPDFSRMLLVALMFIGGSAGSTAGSMKVMRIVVALKAGFRQVRQLFSPASVVRIFVGGKAVPESVVPTVVAFVILFVASWVTGSLLLAAGGHDLETSATASIAALGNIGPGLAAVGPVQNYAFFHPTHKLLLIFLMLVGRLEVYAITALFLRHFWRR
jgi:trk/ktr system potassium uptake protein